MKECLLRRVVSSVGGHYRLRITYITIMTRKQLKPYFFGALALALLIGTTGASAQIMGGAGFENLSEDQQTAVTEARQLRDAGDKEGAKALLEEAGVPLKSKMRKARNHNEDVKTAVEENNYEAFLTATADAPFSDQVDEAFFGKIVEMHSLKAAGDIESAEAIRAELGLPERGEHKRGGQRGMISEAKTK